MRKCIIKFQDSGTAVDPLITTVSREATKIYNNNTSKSLNVVKLWFLQLRLQPSCDAQNRNCLAKWSEKL